MSLRNLSPQHMFQALALEHRPACRFAGKTRADFRRWHQRTWPRVLATLGKFPPRVPPRPQLLAEWEHDGLRKQRWLLDVGRHIAATLLVNFPGDLAARERRPAILCCHGHSPQGKDAVMGKPGLGDGPDGKPSAYGHVMAKAGFVTYAVDWLGFGERNDNQKPNFNNQNGQRDWCNLYYLHATMLGTTSLAFNVTHGQAATDFVSSLPGVDGARLGVMGCSGGGTMALWLALCDRRFRAAEIICYSDLWAYFGIRDINYCGLQVAPGLYALVDLPDLQGLLALRPLLVDIGAYDTCFVVDNAMACYHQVEAIYQAAGAADRLELDLFPGEHGWGGNRSLDFFRRYL